MSNITIDHTKYVSSGMFRPDQIDLIKRTICKGSTDDEFKLFLYQAERTGLDPLARQIYAIKRYDAQLGREVMGIQTSIDGFRLVAERSGKYAGQLGPFWWDGRSWLDVWADSGPPLAAKVGILRNDFKEPLWGVARFDAYSQRRKDGKLTRMWEHMSDVMIAKCAEALGLRKAFPQELSGLYTSDEMEQSTPQEEVVPGAKKPPAPAPNVMKPLITTKDEIAGAYDEMPPYPEGDKITVQQFPAPPISMKELSETAKAAALQGETAFKEFWRPLTVAQRSMLGGMGEELRKLMEGQHDPVTGEV